MAEGMAGAPGTLALMMDEDDGSLMEHCPTSLPFLNDVQKLWVRMEGSFSASYLLLLLDLALLVSQHFEISCCKHAAHLATFPFSPEHSIFLSHT